MAKGGSRLAESDWASGEGQPRVTLGGRGRPAAAYVEQVLGVERFLAGLPEELRSGSYRPEAVKQRAIPKRGGKLRYLGNRDGARPGRAGRPSS